MQCRFEDGKKFERAATYYEAHKVLALVGLVAEE